MSGAIYRVANHWVQATPDYACLLFLHQRSGAPDPTRQVSSHAMQSRHLILVLSLVILVCGQGCFVFRYTVTPPVSGTVVDATTKQPVAGATVGFRKHERRLAMTAADGSFVSRPDHVWRPCFILPGELWPSGGRFFVEASGYMPCEQEIVTRMGRPFTNAQPIELVREAR